MKSNDKKQKIIQKAKRTNFRQEISKATKTPQDLWRLAKWAKDTAREVPKMPTLKFNNQTADMFDEKAEMLKSIFLTAPSPADLSDMEGSLYPASPHCPMIITRSEVSKALHRLKPDKPPGPDGISNRVLKACAEKLVELLTPLFQACVTLSYYPRAFKIANTIALRKIDKGNYTTPKAAEGLPTNCITQHAQQSNGIYHRIKNNLFSGNTSAPTRHTDESEKGQIYRISSGVTNRTGSHDLGTRKR